MALRPAGRPGRAGMDAPGRQFRHDPQHLAQPPRVHRRLPPPGAHHHHWLDAGGGIHADERACSRGRDRTRRRPRRVARVGYVSTARDRRRIEDDRSRGAPDLRGGARPQRPCAVPGAHRGRPGIHACSRQGKGSRQGEGARGQGGRDDVLGHEPLLVPGARALEVRAPVPVQPPDRAWRVPLPLGLRRPEQRLPHGSRLGRAAAPP